MASLRNIPWHVLIKMHTHTQTHIIASILYQLGCFRLWSFDQERGCFFYSKNLIQRILLDKFSTWWCHQDWCFCFCFFFTVHCSTQSLNSPSGGQGQRQLSQIWLVPTVKCLSMTLFRNGSFPKKPSVDVPFHLIVKSWGWYMRMSNFSRFV